MPARRLLYEVEIGERRDLFPELVIPSISLSTMPESLKLKV